MNAQQNPQVDARAVESRAMPAVRAWARRHARALVLAGASLAACGTLAVVAYQLALARVPQHRAALERFVRAQTGFEVRFDALQVGLGWHGPEAVFTRIELLEPKLRGPAVRAPRLTVAFDTWRILRNGQVQAARITLADAQIDLSPLLAAARADGARRSRAPSASRRQGADALLERVRLLDRLPLLRVDIEGGTVRVPGEVEGDPPFSLRVSRASLRRSEQSASASAFVLLPRELGRSLFVALRIDGPLDALGRTSGEARVTGRGLAFGAWRQLAPFVPFAPVAGAGDLSARFDWREGRLGAMDGTLNARGLAWRDPRSQEPIRFVRLRGELAARRRGELLHLQLQGLELDDGQYDGRVANVVLDVRGGGSQIDGRAPSVPLSAVLALARASGQAPEAIGGGVRAAGGVKDLAFSWRAGAPAGQRLRLTAELDDVELLAQRSRATASGLDGTVEASDAHVLVRVRSEVATVRLPELFAQFPDTLALDADLEWQRTATGWRTRSERVRFAHPAFDVRLSGEIEAPTDAATMSSTAATSGAAATNGAAAAVQRLTLRGAIERVDLSRLREQVRVHERWPALGAAMASLESGELASGELTVTALLDPRTLEVREPALEGEVIARALSVAAGPHWPQAQGTDGTLSIADGRVRLVLNGGEVGGLALAQARGQWRVGDGALVRFDASLAGPIERALALAGDRPELRAQLGPLGSLDASGPARLAVLLRPPRVADGETRWRVIANLDGARVAPSGLSPFEGVTGPITLEEGRLLAARLSGRWLDGPVSLSEIPTAPRSGVELAFGAEGRAPVVAAARLLGLEPAFAGVEGETSWRAELRRTRQQARGERSAAWRISFRSSLATAPESLPAALGWARDRRLPVRGEMVLPDGGAGTLQVDAFGSVRVAAGLEARDGVWHATRMGVRFGAGSEEPPVSARIAISGELESIDVAAALSLWNALGIGGESSLDGAIDLGTSALLLGGQDLASARLTGGFGAEGLHLVVSGRSVAGSIKWPPRVDSDAPVELELARLALLEQTLAPGASMLAALALGRATRVAIDDFSWGERRLGRVQATFAAAQDALEIRDLVVAGSAHLTRGLGSCALEPLRCEGRLSVQSANVGALLRETGYRPELRAERGEAQIALAWEPGDTRRGWAAVRGRMELSLSAGVIEPVESLAAGRAFAPLAAPAALLRAAVAAGPASIDFATLKGVYEIDAGVLRTSDLRLVTSASELAASGQLDFSRRAYEMDATFSTSATDVRSALRRVGAQRSFAAALRAARELIGERNRPAAPLAMRLRGSFEAPLLERPAIGGAP